MFNSVRRILMIYRPAQLSHKVIRNFRIMAGVQEKRSDHLQRTAEDRREKVTSQATVKRISDVSSTIKALTMEVKDPSFTFKAGQWVDFFIPDIETVGGYSMCSAPKQLIDSNTLELAVKYSDHPPAHWVHTKCKAGTEVLMRAGGDFHYDPDNSTPSHDLLLIAGGIGINPLLSILHHAVDLQKTGGKGLQKLMLMYTASTQQELVFKEDIQKICQTQEELRHQFFITRGPVPADQSDITGGRIGDEHLTSCFTDGNLQKDRTVCYICGPSPMIKSMETSLLKLGIPKKRIIYEQWW